jgi:undecaprenyl phosphate-alpha-L-ara4N flippase subunit ArnE
MIKNLSLLFFTSILLVSGQTLWKVSTSKFNDQITNKIQLLYYLATSKYFISGCICYIIATALWIYILSQFEFSVIYPVFVGVCIISSILVGSIFFHETENLASKICGSAIIIIGIYIITRK